MAKIVFVCFLLKNIYATLYANITSNYFLLLPPEFEDYIGQGPQAKPIPEDSLFNDNYIYAHDADDSDDDDDGRSIHDSDIEDDA